MAQIEPQEAIDRGEQITIVVDMYLFDATTETYALTESTTPKYTVYKPDGVTVEQVATSMSNVDGATGRYSANYSVPAAAEEGWHPIKFTDAEGTVVIAWGGYLCKR